MKDDYLWDKTGEDGEIRKLEDALRCFRGNSAAPGESPVSISADASKPAFGAGLSGSFRRLKLALSMAAAGAAILTVMIVVYNRTVVPDAMQAAVARSTETARAADDSVPSDASAPVNPAAKVSEEKVEARVKTLTKRFPSKRSNNLAAKQSFRPVLVRKSDADDDPLTDEERYAYRQLMTALSVTGSKLRIVRDAVGGNVDSEAPSGRK